ncbi:MAG: methylglyoxal synthase [Oscillospiraceae bacterium]|jgi:methylglyoxal synthase|nr:methylglyoxal synthase [Oscillospiraceae bacterium]
MIKNKIEQLNIALIAHDTKKALMECFVRSYDKAFMQHHLIASGTTGKLLTSSTGLEIECEASGDMGGVETITSRIDFGEINVVFFFRDPFTKKIHESRADTGLLRACDKFPIPLATNIVTAEALIFAIERGDFNHLIYNRPKLF